MDSEGGTEEEEGEASDEDADDGLENGLASVVADDDSEDGTDDAEDDDDADDEERHLKMISDVTGDASSYLFGVYSYLKLQLLAFAFILQMYAAEQVRRSEKGNLKSRRHMRSPSIT